MANELYAALTQVRTDLRTIEGIEQVHLGMLVTAASTKPNQAIGTVLMADGSPTYDTLTGSEENHSIEISLWWGMDINNQQQQERIEQAVATMWDRLMTKFMGDDADRNLTEQCTIAGIERYTTDFVVLDGKPHRVLTTWMEVKLHTHEV